MTRVAAQKAGFALLTLALAGCSNANHTADDVAIVSEAPPSGSAPATQLSAGGVVVIPSANTAAPSSSAPSGPSGVSSPVALPMDAACELTSASLTKVPPLLLKVGGAPFATVASLKNARVFVQADPVKAGRDPSHRADRPHAAHGAPRA